jgi:hypothetical protein
MTEIESLDDVEMVPVPESGTQAEDPYLEKANKLIDMVDVNMLAHLLRKAGALDEQYKLPEAVGSCSTYIVGPGGAEILITSRGASLAYAWDQMVGFIKLRLQEGYKPVVKGSRSDSSVGHTGPAQSAPASQAVVTPTQPAQPVTSGVKEFACAKLELSIIGDKTYYKMHSQEPMFKQFGLTVWPEVFQNAGIDVTKLANNMDFTGWIAAYEEKPNPKDTSKTQRKVTSLRKA